MKNIEIRKWGRFVLALLSSIFLVLLIWIVIDCFTTKDIATNKVITYNIKDSIDYYVTVTDNDYFTSDEVNDKDIFIPSITDSIDVSFIYDLSGSNFFNGSYDYEVSYVLEANNYEYEEIIYTSDTRVVEGVMNINISDSLVIDFNSIYEKANNYYELTGEDVTLTIYVNFDVGFVVDNYEESINEEQSLSLTVPLTSKLTSIEKSTNVDENKSVVNKYEFDEKFNTWLFVVSMLLILALLPVTVMSYISLFNLTNLKTYKRKLNKIKKKYNYLIREVNSIPKFKNKEIIEVYTFNELLHVKESDDLIINLFEKEEGRECWFYVTCDKEVYLYIMKLDYNEIDMSDKSMVIDLKKHRN